MVKGSFVALRSVKLPAALRSRLLWSVAAMTCLVLADGASSRPQQCWDLNCNDAGCCAWHESLPWIHCPYTTCYSLIVESQVVCRADTQTVGYTQDSLIIGETEQWCRFKEPKCDPFSPTGCAHMSTITQWQCLCDNLGIAAELCPTP